MRIGFVTQLCWERYGGFWTRLFESSGSEVALPERDAVFAALDERHVASVASIPFRLAAAQAASLASCDALVVPALNPESGSERGSALDRWVADFAGALGDAVPGLPELWSVPAEVAEHSGLDGLAAALISAVLREPAAVERVWSKHKALVVSGRWRRRPAASDLPVRAASGSDGGPVIGLVAQPWLLGERLSRAIGERVVDARALNPARQREVGRRFEARLVDSDAEVIGTARTLSARSDVSSIVHVVDEASAGAAWLARRVREQARKPVETVGLEALLDGPMTLDDLLVLPVE